MHSCTKRGRKQIKRVQGVGYPTPYARILHPILHPKSLENTMGFTCGCRKCRRFSRTFFVEGEGESETTVRKVQDIGLLRTKVRMFGFKSTDVFIEEVRCFCFPERGLHFLNVSLSERRGQTESKAKPSLLEAKEEDEVSCLDYPKS